MPRNPYLNNFNYSPTQDLVEDLYLESIKHYGLEVYYIPRTFQKLDKIFGEDILSKFKNTFLIEMYLENFNQMDGEREYVSKFGLEIRDQISLVVSRKRFEFESAKLPPMPSRPVQIESPMMGDLIFFPLSKSLFEIKYVDNKHIFFQQGRLFTYRLDCELYKYSYENFKTGITDIDIIEKNLVQANDVNSDGTVDFVSTKFGLDDSQVIQTESNKVMDYSEKDPFSEGNY